MSVWGKTWGKVCLGAVGVALLLDGSASVKAASAKTSGALGGRSAASIRVHDAVTAWPLLQAVSGAHQWLSDPACQEVFSDFTDLSGTPLAEVLAARGLTAQEQLGRLAFDDGSRHRGCWTPGIAALTSPGHTVIYICPMEFRRLSREPSHARAVVIHELLHSLGLGENPPSSREITERVLKRCGR